MTKNMMLFLVPIIFSQISRLTAHNISVYGDVYEDSEFFIRTFPWIIDNIGGEITVDFYMVGSGRYAVPQMCALEKLRMNTFLQAQYLKCEAEGNPSEYCLCETGIDPEEFKQCVATGGNLSSQATAKFSQLRVERTPIVELSHRSTVFGVEDTWFLKKICTIFGDNLPRGCIKPFACQLKQVQGDNAKRAIAHFDKCCRRELEGCFEKCPATDSITFDATEFPFNEFPYNFSEYENNVNN